MNGRRAHSQSQLAANRRIRGAGRRRFGDSGSWPDPGVWGAAQPWVELCICRQMGASALSRTESKRAWSVARRVQPKGADHVLGVCDAVLDAVAFSSPQASPTKPETQSAGVVQEHGARRRAGGWRSLDPNAGARAASGAACRHPNRRERLAEAILRVITTADLHKARRSSCRSPRSGPGRSMPTTPSCSSSRRAFETVVRTSCGGRDDRTDA
jgi:hypothetical protein